MAEAVEIAPADTVAEAVSDGARYVKEIKRHKWLAALMAAVIGPGGAGAVVYATSDRAKANTQEVEHLKEASNALEPRVNQTEADIRELRASVKGFNSSVSAIKTSTKEIAGGIEELKKENLNRLKSELEEAKREIRRQERINR